MRVEFEKLTFGESKQNRKILKISKNVSSRNVAKIRRKQ